MLPSPLFRLWVEVEWMSCTTVQKAKAAMWLNGDVYQDGGASCCLRKKPSLLQPLHRHPHSVSLKALPPVHRRVAGETGSRRLGSTDGRKRTGISPARSQLCLKLLLTA